MEEKIRVVIYNKTKDYANMQKAEEKCKKYIEKNSNMVLVKSYCDMYMRNSKIHKRKGLKQLIKDREKLKIDLVVIASTPNLTRNTKDFIWAIKELENFRLGSFFVNEKVYGEQMLPSRSLLNIIRLDKERSMQNNESVTEETAGLKL